MFDKFKNLVDIADDFFEEIGLEDTEVGQLVDVVDDLLEDEED